jgi:hypothetical protein
MGMQIGCANVSIKAKLLEVLLDVTTQSTDRSHPQCPRPSGSAPRNAWVHGQWKSLLPLADGLLGRC